MNERLRKLRKTLNMSQTTFGKRVGLKQSTITGYETGNRIPLDSVILLICKEFNSMLLDITTFLNQLNDEQKEALYPIIEEIAKIITKK